MALGVEPTAVSGFRKGGDVEPSVGVAVEEKTEVARPWKVRLRAILLAVDLAAIGITLVVVSLIPVGAADVVAVGMDRIPVGTGVRSTVLAVVWIIALGVSRSRVPRVIGDGLEEFKRVAQGTILTFGWVAIVGFLFQLTLSRRYFMLAFPLGLLLLIAGRWIVRQYIRRQRFAGTFLDRSLIVGLPEDVERVSTEIRRSSGIAPVASYITRYTEDFDTLTEHRASIVAEARRHDVDAVIVAGDLPGGPDEVRYLSWDLESTKADLILASRLIDVAAPRIHLRPLAGIPLVHVSLPRFTGWSYVVKRAMDVVFSTFALLLLAPVFAGIALAIKLDDRGPVFYRQVRTGVNGEPFRIWKFRSMSVNAHERKAEIEAANEADGPLFKMKVDPRVTRVGRILRATSLDELPQFLNTLHGSMSVVGPRPPLPEEVDSYDPAAHRRLLIKPGITGLWQVSGRSNLSWADGLRLDLNYVENWSPLSDIAIIARTAVAVLRREGAY